MSPDARELDNEELPDEQQKQGERLKEMVTEYGLNDVLQMAVNAAFNAGSTDPVAFMGQFLIERKDRVPTVEKVPFISPTKMRLRSLNRAACISQSPLSISQVVSRSIIAGDQSSTLEVDVHCNVNGVVTVAPTFTRPWIAQASPS